MLSVGAVAAAAVSAKVTGEPSTFCAAAMVMSVPALVPSVRRAADRPSAPVVSTAGTTEPPPDADQWTTTPATGSSIGSLARTTSDSGSTAPTGAVCPWPPMAASVADPEELGPVSPPHVTDPAASAASSACRGTRQAPAGPQPEGPGQSRA
jgi:hypothetical protein